MKTCTSCNKEKLEDEFAWKIKANNLRQSVCKDCTKAKSKAHYEKYADGYKKRAIGSKVILQKRNREYIVSLGLKCEQCGENHPACLDFHHINPVSKDLEVSALVARGHSIDRIKKEIEKCKVLCSNCHRKLHWDDRQQC